MRDPEIIEAELIEISGIADDLFHAAAAWIGRVPGGLRRGPGRLPAAGVRRRSPGAPRRCRLPVPGRGSRTILRHGRPGGSRRRHDTALRRLGERARQHCSAGQRAGNLPQRGTGRGYRYGLTGRLGLANVAIETPAP